VERINSRHFEHVVRDCKGEGGKPDSSWSEIGVTFMHKDSLGFDPVLTAAPVNALNASSQTLGSRLRPTVTPARDQPQIPKDAADLEHQQHHVTKP
jgi:hypothetical protein